MIKVQISQFCFCKSQVLYHAFITYIRNIVIYLDANPLQSIISHRLYQMLSFFPSHALPVLLGHYPSELWSAVLLFWSIWQTLRRKYSIIDFTTLKEVLCIRMIMNQYTQQSGLMNMNVKLNISNGLHSHQIRIILSHFGVLCKLGLYVLCMWMYCIITGALTCQRWNWYSRTFSKMHLKPQICIFGLPHTHTMLINTDDHLIPDYNSKTHLPLKYHWPKIWASKPQVIFFKLQCYYGILMETKQNHDNK